MTVVDTPPLVDIVQHLIRNTEAGHVLVSAAIIDEWLQKLLLTAMRDLSEKVSERIFGSYGPLYELSPKADIAYAFGLIDNETLAILRTIRDIRNDFAHTRELLNLQSPEMVKRCQALPGWRKGSDAKELFDATVTKCLETMDGKTQELLFKHATAPDDASPDK